MVSVRRLVWDEWNVAHIARHGITQDEVDEICCSKPFASATYKGRLRLIGETRSGKIVTVILAPKGEDVYYPVTARPASRKERKIYQEHKEVN